MWHAMQQLQRKIAGSGLTKETFMQPPTPLYEMAVEGALYNLFRVLGKATALSDGTKVQFPRIPWDELRGMRNRIAHDYTGMRFDVVWDTIEEGLPIIQELCVGYCELMGISIEDIAAPDEPA